MPWSGEARRTVRSAAAFCLAVGMAPMGCGVTPGPRVRLTIRRTDPRARFFVNWSYEAVTL